MADILDKDLVGIVGSIFATSPEAMKIARERADLTRAQAVAQAEAQQMGGGTALSANIMGGQAVRQLGGLLGAEDPVMQRESAKRQLAQGLDMSSPEAVMEYANRLNNAGLQQEAAQAIVAARAMQQQMGNIRKTGAEEQRALAQAAGEQNKVMNEMKVRQEIAALGPNATQEQILAVVSRYGSPDTVLRTLQASADRQSAIESRRSMAEEKSAEKRAEKEAKLGQQQEMAIGAVDRVINEVKEAKPLVGKLTAGFGGSTLSSIPGTEARDLQAKLTTIKANLGFDRLQQMRDASPTGGALGQVAVQELVALQSTVASLDQAQSPKQLREALNKIEEHYTKWRATVRKAAGQEQSVEAQPATGTQSKTVDFNTLPKGR